MMLQNKTAAFSINGIIPVQVIHAAGTCIQSQIPAFHIALVTTWMVTFVFCPKDMSFGLQDFPKTICYVNLSDTFLLVSSVELISHPEKWAVCLDVMFLSLYMIEPVTCICRCRDKLCLLKNVFQSVP